VPHATLEAGSHGAQQTRSVGPVLTGGEMHTVPRSHSVPTPSQVRHARPIESIAGGISTPQGIVRELSQRGQHASSRHSEPASHSVPRPEHGEPVLHVAGMSTPHATSVGARHSSPHSQLPDTHVRPLGQLPSQWPPQPSGAPHAPSEGQCGTHSQVPVSGLHSSPGVGQGPVQKPPQPSGAPQTASAGQRRTHVHTPATQRSGATHAGSQPHVPVQSPSWQTSPGAQVTPAHGFGMHAPARQNSPSAQVTPSQAERGEQLTWQVDPSPQAASHGWMGTHVPLAGSQ
jgi:hypothetical protein